MRKFILMIFSVSIFFTVLGGIVRQAEKFLAPDETSLTVYTRISSDENPIPPPLPPDADEHFLIVKNRSGNTPDFNIKIQPPVPNQPEQPFVFERQTSETPLEQGLAKPRISEKKIVIFQRKNAEEKKTSESDDAESLPITVFIDKGKKSK